MATTATRSSWSPPSVGDLTVPMIAESTSAPSSASSHFAGAPASRCLVPLPSALCRDRQRRRVLLAQRGRTASTSTTRPHGTEAAAGRGAGHRHRLDRRRVCARRPDAHRQYGSECVPSMRASPTRITLNGTTRTSSSLSSSPQSTARRSTVSASRTAYVPRQTTPDLTDIRLVLGHQGARYLPPGDLLFP
jgi:hypothetical protein